ncbi:hypothetical protein MMC30_004882 [Trapelia coarctata]|nr:hypothetical protein [Trapelia coarctata]
MRSSALIISAFTPLRPVFGLYNLQDHYTATNWLDSFSFQAIPDPTQGYVTFADSASAQKMGHFKTDNGKVYMGVDFTNPAIDPGRMSLRMQSNKAYTHALVVLDLAHMPASTCGTWPAFWTTKTDTWPTDGEIDIIEGVNSQRSNFMTLHTGGPACSISNDATLFASSSQLLHTGCDLNAPGQAKDVGCSINNTLPTSYGTGFNANGGGIYAMEWTSAHITIWFFPHTSTPSDIAAANPDPGKWGTPAARFQGPGCNMDSSFRNHNIIFDTTFCGVWAGDTDWTTSGCAAAHGPSCKDYVQKNPGDFKETFWEVNSLMVYQDDGKAAAAPPAASSAALSAPSALRVFSQLASAVASAKPKTPAATVTVTAPAVTHTVFARDREI